MILLIMWAILMGFCLLIALTSKLDTDFLCLWVLGMVCLIIKVSIDYYFEKLKEVKK